VCACVCVCVCVCARVCVCGGGWVIEFVSLVNEQRYATPKTWQFSWQLIYCGTIQVGVASRMADRSSWLGKQTHGWAYGSNGFICHSTGRDAGPYDTEYGVRFCPGASIRVFLDMDARTLEFAVIRLDGTINRFGVAYSNLPSVVYPAVSLRSPGVATVSDYESIASSFRSSAARAA